MLKPYVGIPMGDPCGIGPEIIVKALTDEAVYNICNPVVIGSYDIINSAINICELNDSVEVNLIMEPAEGDYQAGVVNLINLNNVDASELYFGKMSADAGRASYEYIEKCTELCLNNSLDSMATAPINKEAIKAAGIKNAGHTEILAELTGTQDPLTMFEVANMRVFFLSRHVSLRQAIDMVNKDRVLEYIIRCNEALSKLGITDGVMAVAALNPHASDNGMFGDEEANEIIPAINEAKKLGIAVEGPIGADSVFYQAYHGKYNSVLSLYHDQGHIATKTLSFEETISVTIGLPFIRTSVDHGTAFDIAGTGMASPTSMIEAIILAAKYASLQE